jgi:hypothetical protein
MNLWSPAHGLGLEKIELSRLLIQVMNGYEEAIE